MRFPTFQSVFHLVDLFLNRPAVWRVLQEVRRQRLTYLEPAALADLADAVLGLEKNKVAGICVEAGCALGGSALVIAAAKSSDRPFFVYDTFEQIPSPSSTDGSDAHERYAQIVSGNSPGLGGDVYYGYRKDLLQQVQQSFDRFGFPIERNQVKLVKGLFQDTLNLDQPIAFAHLDCDWYDSVMVCLQRIEPRLVMQGCLVIDDYSHWSGCRKAVDEYFADKQPRYQFTQTSRLHIRRIG